MDVKSLEALLARVASGKLSTKKALEKLRALPFESLADATIDHHRALRTGIPEIIYGESKTVDQIVRIANRILAHEQPLLITRVEDEKGTEIAARLDGVCQDTLSRTVYKKAPKTRAKGLVAVVTAGTSDLPIAEEAAITLELLGNRVERVFDVGVAGVHRMVDQLPVLQSARVVIVAAGMEGALASIVGGLVACPVIALPTSVGYGASFGGIAALLGMLNSCAPGVSVVNIDNGFGAAVAAHKINQPQRP